MCSGQHESASLWLRLETTYSKIQGFSSPLCLFQIFIIIIHYLTQIPDISFHLCSWRDQIISICPSDLLSHLHLIHNFTRGNPLTTGYLCLKHLPCALSCVTHVCIIQNICTYMKQHTHIPRSPSCCGSLVFVTVTYVFCHLGENQSLSQVTVQHLPRLTHIFFLFSLPRSHSCTLRHMHIFPTCPLIKIIQNLPK